MRPRKGAFFHDEANQLFLQAPLLALREYYDSLDAENRSTWTAVPKRG